VRRVVPFILLLAFAAYGQQERIAIIQTLDDRDSIGFSDLAYLTDRLRETAVNVLPSQRYGIMTTESIVAFLGSQERAIKACKEASCLAELGRKVSADYVAQAHIGRFDRNLTIKTELYNSKSGTLMGSFTGYSQNISGLLDIIDAKASDLFKRIPEVASSISNEKSTEESYKTNYEITYNPIPDASSSNILTDSRDGKKYKIVKIRNQIWMAENLNYEVENSKCYKNDTVNCSVYGRLYNWYMAKSACPKGWHLPIRAEWEILTDAVGGEETAGKHLKTRFGWYKNRNGLDTYSFAALPGGLGVPGSIFRSFRRGGDDGYWWSASDKNGVRMGYDSDKAYYLYRNPKLFFSVRCLKD